MNIVLKSYDEITKVVGMEILELVKQNPKAKICLPSGSTPVPIFDFIINNCVGIDFSQVTFVGLDEFIGLGHSDDGSCFYMLYRDFFSKMKIAKEQIIFFDGKGDNQKIVDYIENNTLDYVVLGVGRNGHIGLNEPGIIQNGRVLEVELAQTTKNVMSKYFENEPVICEKGITMSLDYLKMANKIVVVINDTSKQEVFNLIKENKDMPVTNILQSEKAVLLVLEELK